MKIEHFGCLLISNSRSQAFIQKLIKESLIPEKIIYVDLQKQKKTTQVSQDPTISSAIQRAFRDRKYFLYSKSSQAVIPLHDKVSKKYASFDPEQSVIVTLKKAGIDYDTIQATSLNDTQVVEAVKRANLRYCIFSGGGILKKEILSLGTKFIHIHPGYLPDVKGSMCIEWSILRQGKCGVTAFFMVEKIDRGDIIARKYFDIPELEHNSVPALYSPHIRSELLIEIMKEYVGKKEFHTTPQKAEQGEFYYKMHPAIHNIVFFESEKFYRN